MALKYSGTVAVTHEPPSLREVRRQVARGLKSVTLHILVLCNHSIAFFFKFKKKKKRPLVLKFEKIPQTHLFWLSAIK